MRLGKRPPEVSSNSGFLAYVLIQSYQHWHLVALCPPSQSPCKDRAASSRVLQGTSHCSASVGDWVGLAKTRPFALLRHFCPQWVAFAVLHTHAKPPSQPYFTTLARLLYCHCANSPLTMSHLLLSFLCFHRSRSQMKGPKPPMS